MPTTRVARRRHRRARNEALR